LLWYKKKKKKKKRKKKKKKKKEKKKEKKTLFQFSAATQHNPSLSYNCMSLRQLGVPRRPPPRSPCDGGMSSPRATDHLVIALRFNSQLDAAATQTSDTNRWVKIYAGSPFQGQ